MKNTGFKVKERLIAKYFEKDSKKNLQRSTDINVLLNRVRLNQKRTLKKRIVLSIILAGLVTSLSIYFII